MSNELKELGEFKKIVLFAIEKITPLRTDLLRSVEEGMPTPRTGSKTLSANARSEGIAALYYEMELRKGSFREKGMKELRSVILGQYLPLMFPDCVSLTRMVELYDKVEGISLRYVKGEITEEQYKNLLAEK